MAPALEVLNIAIKSTVSLYIKYWLNLVVNTFNTGAIKVKFRIGLILLVNSLKMQLLVGEIVFYIICADTPFLINLQDLDFLGCYYNNFTNEVVTPILIVLVA